MASQPPPVILRFDLDDKGGVKIERVNAGLDKMGKQAGKAAAGARLLDRALAISTQVVKAGGVAAVVAAGGYALMARRMNELDASMKAATALGLTARQLTSLEYAMSLAGVKSDRLFEGINKLNIAVGRAAEGNAEMLAAFTALGITLEDIEGLGTEGKLMRIADALAGITDTSRRAALSAKIFGDRQRQLVSALSAGSDAIREQQREAERLGYAITDLYAQRLQEFNDSQERVRRSSKALVDLFANEFSPVMTRINNDIADAATKQGVFREAVESAALGAEVGYLTLKNAISGVIAEQRELRRLADEGRYGEFAGNRGIVIPPVIPAAFEAIRARRQEQEQIKRQREEQEKIAALDRERAAMARAHAAEGDAMVAALLAEADALDAQREAARKLAEDEQRRTDELRAQLALLDQQATEQTRQLRIQQGYAAAGNVPGPLGGNVGGIYGLTMDAADQQEQIQQLEAMQVEAMERAIALEELTGQRQTAIRERYAQRQVDIERAKNAAVLGLAAGLMGETAATLENYSRATGKKSREMALAQKALAIGQATVNTFLAATAVMANTAVLGPVVAAAASKFIVGLGLANVALIAATPIETYHNGGLVTGPGGGQFGGRNLRADEVPAVLQTGEVVLSRADVAMLTGRSGGAGTPSAPAAGPVVEAVILREEALENWAMSRRGRRAINMAVER